MTINRSMIQWFRASASYINAHRGKVFVVLLSGECLADENFAHIVYDLSILHSLGVKLVLVHGSRPQISSALQASGLQSGYHQNLRITNADAMAVVKQVVGGLAADLDAMLSMNLTNSPMQGADIRLSRGNFVVAQPVGIHDGIDYHYTGQLRKVRKQAIQAQLDQGNLVLLSNLGYSLTGEVFNLSAEEVATEVAIALEAEKLIFTLPTTGVLDSEGQLVSALSEQDAVDIVARLEQHEDNDSVCIRQALLAALRAYRGHVHRTHLIGYKDNGALLQELFTREGQGSLLSADSFDELRDARIEDIAGILALIKPLEADGTLVVRSRERLETEIENFLVIELEGSIIACAALYPVGPDSAELACIAIHPQFRDNKLGSRLLQRLESTARAQGMRQLFVLTTVAAHWFLEQGFVEVSPIDLPESRQQLYNYQRNSKVLRKQIVQ